MLAAAKRISRKLTGAWKMNHEPSRSLGDRLLTAYRQVYAKSTPGWADLKELKDAGAAAEEHGLLLIEELSGLFNSVDDDTPANAYRALGDVIAELAVLAHQGVEARNTALSMLAESEGSQDGD